LLSYLPTMQPSNMVLFELKYIYDSLDPISVVYVQAVMVKVKNEV